MSAILKSISRLRPGDGITLVEFALTLPFLMLLLMGIFDLGSAVYINNTVALAAREGARQGIILSSTDSDIRAQVRKTAQGLNLTDQQIQISPSPSRSPGNTVMVRVVYNYTPLTPIIGNIIGGGLQLSSQATMMVE
jgi:Flp pilus assembly protein TadG